MILISNMKKEEKLQQFIEDISNIDAGDWRKKYKDSEELLLLVSQGLHHLLNELDSQHREKSHVTYEEVSSLQVPIPHVAETGKFDRRKFDEKFNMYKDLDRNEVKEIVFSHIDRLANTIPEAEHWDTEAKEVAKHVLEIYDGEKGNSYMQEKWLTLILKLFEKADFEIRNYYKSKLHIDNLYDTTAKKSRTIIRLLQIMNNFKPDTIRKIVKDGTDIVTQDEFDSLLNQNWIDLSSVHAIHPDFLECFGNEILKEMDRCHDSNKFNRLKKIYDKLQEAIIK